MAKPGKDAFLFVREVIRVTPVKFFSAVYPQRDALITVIGNTDRSFAPLYYEIERIVLDT